MEQEAQSARVQRGAQRAGVAAAGLALGEHRSRRRVDLRPREPRGLLRAESRCAGPGVPVEIEAETVVHGDQVRECRLCRCFRPVTDS
jgi:hypothetical protein